MSFDSKKKKKKKKKNDRNTIAQVHTKNQGEPTTSQEKYVPQRMLENK